MDERGSEVRDGLRGEEDWRLECDIDIVPFVEISLDL
jgi:hypothetical protein